MAVNYTKNDRNAVKTQIFRKKFAYSKNYDYICAKFTNMAKISNYIQRIFPQRFRVLFNNWQGGMFGGWGFEHKDFASLIWYNICDLLADILEDVQMAPGNLSDDGMVLFSQFKAFVYAWGRPVLQMIWDKGYCVIGYSSAQGRFWIMTQTEYTQVVDGDTDLIRPYDPAVQVYVMRSAAYITHKLSDRMLCCSWLNFLDDICNSSATVNKRLGALVIASPKNVTSAQTPFVMGEEQKKKLEKEVRDNYGSLPKQSNFMVLPREMTWQTVNLAGLDLKTLEKAKFCILAICDRMKVPANQVAIVDANSAKTLANGSELREGDRAKYASFRRVFERTFADMARDLGISFTYTITGEPGTQAAPAAGTQTV